jgi:hypothetical protein
LPHSKIHWRDGPVLKAHPLYCGSGIDERMIGAAGRYFNVSDGLGLEQAVILVTHQDSEVSGKRNGTFRKLFDRMGVARKSCKHCSG